MRVGLTGKIRFNPFTVVTSVRSSAKVRTWKIDKDQPKILKYIRAHPSKFGNSARRATEGVLGSHGVGVDWITLAHWKRLVCRTLASKDAARRQSDDGLRMQRSSPEGRMTAGRAEACLIGVAGMLREQQKGIAR
jgi:hypothetical protein